MTRSALVLLLALLTSGCAEILTPMLLLNAASSGVNAYQGREQRKATEALTDEVRALREEIARLRLGREETCRLELPSLPHMPTIPIPGPYEGGSMTLEVPPPLCMSNPPVVCPK